MASWRAATVGAVKPGPVRDHQVDALRHRGGVSGNVLALRRGGMEGDKEAVEAAVFLRLGHSPDVVAVDDRPLGWMNLRLVLRADKANKLNVLAHGGLLFLRSDERAAGRRSQTVSCRRLGAGCGCRPGASAKRSPTASFRRGIGIVVFDTEFRSRRERRVEKAGWLWRRGRSRSTCRSKRDAALVQHQHPVGEKQRLVHVMGDEKNGRAVGSPERRDQRSGS